MGKGNGNNNQTTKAAFKDVTQVSVGTKCSIKELRNYAETGAGINPVAMRLIDQKVGGRGHLQMMFVEYDR
jgi:hypothetical protein